MWKTAAQDAKDPARVSYCQKRVSELLSRMSLVNHLSILILYILTDLKRGS